MSKPFLMLFFAFVMGYTGYVFIASSPVERLNRTCGPFTLWPGQLVVAAVKIGASEHTEETRNTFEGGFNTCRRWLWNAFYEEEYQQMRAGAAKSTKSQTTDSKEGAK
jgi:hypothetical protein